MKWKGIFLVWLGVGVGLLASPSLWAERHDPGPPHPEEGWQGQHLEKDRDGGSQYSRGPRDGEGFRRGPRDAGIMGSSERGRGRGFGGPPERGGNGGPGERDGFRGRFGRVGTAELMAFLKEHERELAEKLDKLQKEDEKKFEWQISALKRMYGPIMRMMEENPEMAKLSLKSIRLRVQVQETVKKAKEAADDKAKQAATQELKGKLGELFGVIVSLEEKRLDSFEKRMKEWPSQMDNPRGSPGTAVKDEEREHRETRRGPGSRSEGNMSEGRGSFRGGRGPGGRGGFGGPGRGPGPGGFDRERFAEFARSRMEQKKKNIVIWKDNKDSIVQQRSDELLKGLQPFPWGG